MREEWTEIRGYEGRYAISTLGRVKTLGERKVIMKPQVRKPRGTGQGYLTVSLRNKEGKQKTWNIHKLVALTFIINPNKYPQINHIDGNNHNNCVNNLEWCTAKHNREHAKRLGLYTKRNT